MPSFEWVRPGCRNVLQTRRTDADGASLEAARYALLEWLTFDMNVHFFLQH